LLADLGVTKPHSRPYVSVSDANANDVNVVHEGLPNAEVAQGVVFCRALCEQPVFLESAKNAMS